MSDFTLVPPEGSITDTAGNVWSLGAPVVHGQELLRNGVQFASGQGVLLLYFGQNVYTENDLGQWYVASASDWQSVPGDPRQTSVSGIDVSHYQGNVDWAKVKASGQSFVFVKATESNDYTDDRFADNWTGAKAAGLLRGAYHFYRFAASPQSQADRFLVALNGDLGELPIVVDVEDGATSLSSIGDLRQFLDVIQQRTGKRCIIYTGNWYWTSQRWGGSVPWARDHDLWIADYRNPPPSCPSDWPAWKFWQYSSSGTVSGISVAVDLNYFNGTNLDLQTYANRAG